MNCSAVSGKKKMCLRNGRKGQLIKIPKKGNFSPFFFRGIIILSVTGKIMNRGILPCVKAAADAELQTTELDSGEIDHMLTK